MRRRRRHFGGQSIPTSITDALSSDSGLWKDGALSAAALTILSGKAVWSPTEGSELHTNANAASDPNGNEANGTTGMSAPNTTFSVETSDVNTGLYAIKAVSTVSNGAARTAKSLNNATRGWFIRRQNAKNSVGTWKIENLSGGHDVQIPLTGSYAPYVDISFKTADFFEWDIYNSGAGVGHTLLMDNLSIKQLTLASLVRVQRIYYPSTIKADIIMTPWTETGVIMFKDANNWVLANLHRIGALGKVDLIKCVSGTMTIVSGNQAITYADSATLQLVPAADMQTWSVKYGAATPINASAITDFAATGIWYAGLFNTYNPADASQVAFANFAAAQIGGAAPF